MATKIIGDNTKIISTGYVPRNWQEIVHRLIRRFSVVLVHRRGGKTIMAVNHLINQALGCKLPLPQYAYIAPTFAQAKRIVWRYLKEYLREIPDVVFNEAELSCTLPHNKAKIMLLSGENYDSIRGIYLDGCIIDEYASMTPLVWQEAVRPTLSDRSGWCLFLGTPKGNNHFKDVYDYARDGGNPEWYAAMFRASDTNLLAESELRSARDTMSEEQFLQEYQCSFSAGIVGSYFSKEIEKARCDGRIYKIPYDPSLLVHTAWDLGINDTTAIWFFQEDRGVKRFIDYYEKSGASLPDIVRDLREKKYVYGEHLLPHDVNVRDLSTGQTRRQILRGLGLDKLRVIQRVKYKRDSIDSARRLLHKCYFDVDKCKKGLNALENYKKKWNEKNQCFDDSPLHDWSSNGADAFQQAAMGDKYKFNNDAGDDSMGRQSERSDIYSEGSYNPFSR